MSEDKRIRKTKRILKQTLIELLSQKSFEQLTVKELCEKSETSRITFYTHYTDKYDLVNDIFVDMADAAKLSFANKQAQRNPNGDPYQSYYNLLECIMDTMLANTNFFLHTSEKESPYLNVTFCNFVQHYMEIRIEKESALLKPKYSPSKTSMFIIYGLWGFIEQAIREQEAFERIRMQTLDILIGLLKSESLFVK